MTAENAGDCVAAGANFLVAGSAVFKDGPAAYAQAIEDIRRAAESAIGAVRMISRYSRPEMVAIWEPQTRFRIWFEIEAHACDALAEIGVIPKEAAREHLGEGRATSRSMSRASTRSSASRNMTSSPSSRISPNSSARIRASCIRA